MMAFDSLDRIIKEGFSELKPEWEDKGEYEWEYRKQRE